MNRVHLIVEGILVVAVVTLAALIWSQSSQLDSVAEETQLLHAKVDHMTAHSERLKPKESESNQKVERAPGSDRVRAEEDWPDTLEPEERALWQARAQQELDEQVESFDIDDPEVRMKLRNVIAEERESAREERRNRTLERREEAIRERVRGVADEAGFDHTTATQVEDILVVELAEISELFRKAREDGSWRDARDQISTVRRASDEQARALMNDEEYEAYEEMRNEELERWGRGRRGRGDRRSNDSDENRDSGAQRDR